jgi:SAM-dependent methyltransferase
MATERQGVHGLEALSWLPSYPHIRALMTDLITATYTNLLPQPAAGFANALVRFLSELQSETPPLEIHRRLARLRENFEVSGLAAYYTATFRKRNLSASLSRVSEGFYRGKVLDVGADDNFLGSILEERTDVDMITGIDIQDRPNRWRSSRTNFVRMSRPDEIPLPPLEFNTAICRYSLHHMAESIQIAVLEEVFRCLRSQGILIIWENCISRTKLPEECFDQQIFQRINQLGDEERQVLLSAMDVVSFAIKEKLQPFPFSFRTLEEWHDLLASRWRIIAVRYVGLPLLDLHQVPLGILVVQKL